jgi:hypothetical protein
MAKLLNIYNTGLIVETHVLETEKEALEIVKNHLDTLENDYDRGVTSYSCTETDAEVPTKKTNKNK